ncbi:MAG: ABC transporter substrate-binding protein [Desulfobacteraceae bacterium]
MHFHWSTGKSLQNIRVRLIQRINFDKINIFFIVLLGALLFPALFCPGPAMGSEIRIADNQGDWGYPNPFRHYPRGPGYIRMSLVFDTLVWKDEKGVVPALAETWSYDPDKKAFVFHLNPKAQWHDGRPLTAEDVAFTIDYFKKHPYFWIFIDVLDHARAVDDHTVIIYLKRAYSPFLSEIGGTMPILPRHIWEPVKDPKTFNTPSAFIGSGPYMFKDFNKTQGTYLFKAFKHYYQGCPKKDRLIYIKSKKPMMSLVTGQADLAAIQPDMAETLEKKGFIIIKNERGWNKKLMINHKKPLLNHKVFRQALAFAINQQEIIDKAHRGLAAPASYGLLSIDHPMYNPATPGYQYNPDRAKRIISSLGWTLKEDGFFYRDGKILEFELISSNIAVAGENVADRDGEIIRKHLNDIGIKVHLRILEPATTDSRVRKWDFDLAISGHGGVAGDPKILCEMISSQYGAGSVNSARFDADPELNRLLKEQMREMDPAERKKIVFKIQEMYADQLPAISLYYPDTMAAYNPDCRVTWFYTRGGIGKGIPIPQNKISLIR